MTDKIVVFVTCDAQDQARRIARHLVEERLAACVSVTGSAVGSVYRWKDEVAEAEEWLLVIKSRRGLFPVIRAEIQKLHTYEVPEVIAVPIVDGSEPYLAWMDRELRPDPE